MSWGSVVSCRVAVAELVLRLGRCVVSICRTFVERLSNGCQTPHHCVRRVSPGGVLSHWIRLVGVEDSMRDGSHRVVL